MDSGRNKQDERFTRGTGGPLVLLKAGIQTGWTGKRTNEYATELDGGGFKPFLKGPSRQ